jgi:transposase-like protein/ribosomal protein L37E
MNLIQFTSRFPNEASCRKYLRLKREEEGIQCRRCGSHEYFWLVNIEKWQCRKCCSRTNLRAGTIMEKSKLPLMYWFIAIHLIVATKKSFSALELQYQLGHKRYEPIWYMLTKIRIAMGKRDSKYKLKGQIEMDEALFTVVTIDRSKKDEDLNLYNEKQKRGRGSQKKLNVLVMTESTYNPNNKIKHRPSRMLGYIKMIVIDDASASSINYEVKKAINPSSIVLTDSWTGYTNIKDIVKEHQKMIVKSKDADKKLPWVHKVISNAKRLFLGVHHSIGREYLQNYLNEFCYKLNRRNHREIIFDRMITAGIADTWY